MDIAIITPTRDRLEKLAKVRDCIKNQTIQPCCWCVADDSSQPIPKEFFYPLGGIPLSYKHTRRVFNVSVALNTALALDAAKADVYAIFEDDDYYPPTYLENAVSLFRTTDDELLGNRRFLDYRLSDPSYRLRFDLTTTGNIRFAEWHQTLIRGERLKREIVSFLRYFPSEFYPDCLVKRELLREYDNYTLVDFGEQHSVVSLKGYGKNPHEGVLDAHRSSVGFTSDPEYAMLRRWLGKDIERYAEFMIPRIEE